jgi:hypothetical protein
LTSTEWFEPDTGMWSPGPELVHPRASHVAVELGGGQVLAAGGHPEPGIFGGLSGITSTTEVLDTDTAEWRETAPLVSARAAASAVTLSTDDVLLCGGLGESSDTSGCQVFDSFAETWRWSGFLGDVGDGATRTITRAGDVVIGLHPLGAMRFVPASDGWQRTADMLRPRSHHVAVGLSDGFLLVAGGSPWAEVRLSEIYSVADDSWSAGPMLSSAYLFARAARLTNGRVLLVGEAGAELFIPGRGD